MAYYENITARRTSSNGEIARRKTIYIAQEFP
jgi:hypothetical protein